MKKLSTSFLRYILVGGFFGALTIPMLSHSPQGFWGGYLFILYFAVVLAGGVAIHRYLKKDEINVWLYGSELIIEKDRVKCSVPFQNVRDISLDPDIANVAYHGACYHVDLKFKEPIALGEEITFILAGRGDQKDKNYEALMRAWMEYRGKRG